jgi:hypothetical protein
MKYLAFVAFVTSVLTSCNPASYKIMEEGVEDALHVGEEVVNQPTKNAPSKN